jgi:hypothetical protein
MKNTDHDLTLSKLRPLDIACHAQVDEWSYFQQFFYTGQIKDDPAKLYENSPQN